MQFPDQFLMHPTPLGCKDLIHNSSDPILLEEAGVADNVKQCDARMLQDSDSTFKAHVEGNYKFMLVGSMYSKTVTVVIKVNSTETSRFTDSVETHTTRFFRRQFELFLHEAEEVYLKGYCDCTSYVSYGSCQKICFRKITLYGELV